MANQKNWPNVGPFPGCSLDNSSRNREYQKHVSLHQARKKNAALPGNKITCRRIPKSHHGCTVFGYTPPQLTEQQLEGLYQGPCSEHCMDMLFRFSKTGHFLLAFNLVIASGISRFNRQQVRLDVPGLPCSCTRGNGDGYARTQGLSQTLHYPILAFLVPIR